MSFRVDACVALHQGDRKEQQDRVDLFRHDRARGVIMAVVADGMGGHTGGALAAEQVLHTAQTSLNQFSPSTELPQEMLAASMLEAHTMICASRFINEKDPHSTAVMLLLEKDRAAWGHCGDSRLYHFRQGGLLKRTRDHSYVEHLLATGRISPEQAAIHPERNKLLTALGGKDAPRLDFDYCDGLQAGDVFVLCSDGVWAYFDDEELGFIVAGYPARQAAEVIVQRARERAAGTGDNIGLVIVRLQEAGAAAAARPATKSGWKR